MNQAPSYVYASISLLRFLFGSSNLIVYFILA